MRGVRYQALTPWQRRLTVAESFDEEEIVCLTIWHPVRWTKRAERASAPYTASGWSI
jgi:hypothetical protein